MTAPALTTCQWCQAQFPVTLTACPRCGAGTDVRLSQDMAGWVELPGTKDMAKIHLGQSHAQIEGTQVPVVDVALAADDSVFCTHDKLLWHDGQVQLGNKKGGGMFKRMRAGMPLTLLEATGPGRIAFSDNAPGELVIMPLNPGQAVYAREHHMLLATGNIDFEGMQAPMNYVTGDSNDRETHWPLGFYLDEFKPIDDKPGLVILHAVGNVFVRSLAAGQTIDVAPHSFLAAMGTNLQLLNERRMTGWSGRAYSHYLSIRVSGPGWAWIQSGTHGETEVYEPIIDGRNMVIRNL